jgi:proteic killer suppression protein
MKIAYANNRIEKICTDEKRGRKELGQVGMKILTGRLVQIAEAKNLDELRSRPGSWHELTGDRWGQLAASLDGPNRLIFEPNNDPRPTKSDGGLDWSAVTEIMILEITDYH